MDSSLERDAISFQPDPETSRATTVQLGPEPFAVQYNMKHPKRGLVLIFNHKYFECHNCPPREGTNKDRDDLSELFRKLKFNVKCYNDLTKEKVRNTLIAAAMENHSEEDCIVVVVLSHGDKGKIYAKDSHYNTDMLWTYFDGKHAPSLIGKPKLFFIQACRGEGVDGGVKLQSHIEIDSIGTHSKNNFYSIPVMADFLMMYSTVEDFLSWRNPKLGSYFIQSLIRQLANHASEKDLLSILTYVNREVAIGYSKEMEKTGNVGYANKQMSCIVSMLTREIYFS